MWQWNTLVVAGDGGFHQMWVSDNLVGSKRRFVVSATGSDRLQQTAVGFGRQR